MGIFGTKDGKESAFQKAKREAKEESQKEYDAAKNAGMARIGRGVGKAQASLTENPKSKVLRAFAPSTNKKKGKSKGAKWLLGGLKKAGSNFKANTAKFEQGRGQSARVGSSLGGSIGAALNGDKLEPRAPKSGKKRKVVTTYYE